MVELPDNCGARVERCVLVQVMRWLPGMRRMMAERTGQGTARYAGTYTRSQNHSAPLGGGGGVTP